MREETDVHVCALLEPNQHSISFPSLARREQEGTHQECAEWSEVSRKMKRSLFMAIIRSIKFGIRFQKQFVYK